MLSFLPGVVIGIISLSMYILNTIFWSFFLFLFFIIKLIIPNKPIRKIITRLLDKISSLWISCNNINLMITKKIDWDIEGLDKLKMEDWYLVISNHKSWVDILVLQKIFNNKIPFLKFFIKQELIWVPILGVAWWALDYPFMKRYSKSYLQKHPECAGKDLEITKKACEKFRTTPVSVMNFVEGTRFTKEKQKKQNSNYENLLKPKAGGIAFVLGAMGDQINNILNVTILYPHGLKNFWAFLCGDVSKIVVKVETIPVTKDLLGDYFNDSEYRAFFQQWVNDLWVKKDQNIKKWLDENKPKTVQEGSVHLNYLPEFVPV